MIVKIDKSFEKDFKKAGNQRLNPKLLATIENIQQAMKLTDIKNIKKLKGSTDLYRIRLGDYRIGVIINKKEVQLIRFLHRKEIYRYFP
jgi:mRNA interferase RelE/StbE